ncbi:MAG: T9SS type A sorting domain-containing protein [Bacteroidetes bacterium]|nr:T9SS type A sorting domain-containing protein [Bacteroidota bacterium]
MKQFFYAFGFLILMATISATYVFGGSQNPAVEVFHLTGPLGFIENKGQFLNQDKQPRTDLLYLFKRPGMKVQLMKNRISYEMYTMTADNRFSEAEGAPNFYDLDREDWPQPDWHCKSHRIDVEFIGANPNPEIVSEEMMPDYLNYYLGYTPVDGITRVRQYNKITYKNLYNKIDLVLIATPDQNPQRALAYDFVVHPGGDINDIRYRYHGGTKQTLHENGMLETETDLGSIQEYIPHSYLQNENGDKISSANVSFYFNKDEISFRAGNFDKSKSLVIDPYLVWATYCGGDTSEEGRGLATDSSGHVAIIGATASSNNIATDGAYDTEILGIGDIFLEKYDSLGARNWGTYYGGSSRDQARGVITDPDGNFYLGCHTDSPDGIATPDAWRPYFSGGIGDDAVLAYFSSDGFRVWATYFGGTNEEIVRRLARTKDGEVYMVGYTDSDTGVATPGTHQTVYGGGTADLFLAKWTADGQLIWATYVGGNSEDHGRSVSVDKWGNAYVNGSSASEGLGTPGVSRPNIADKQDYLLAKLTADGQLAWFSYWGGKFEDRGRGVFVNPTSTYVYFTGYTASDTGIATPGAYQDYYNFNYGPNGLYHDIVAMKWTLDGQIVWGTYLGGQNDDRGRSLTMATNNELLISGSTESYDTMATPDAIQTTHVGAGGDMFLQIFDTTGYRLYGTFYGGDKDEDNLALAVSYNKQNVYLIGTARSDNVATPDAAQPVIGGLDDALLVKIHIADLATGIKDVENTSGIELYPNPANGNFTLSFSNFKRETAQVDLMNLVGQRVMNIYKGRTNEKFTTQVDVSNLPAGVYYVKVMLGDKATSKKLVVEK